MVILGKERTQVLRHRMEMPHVQTAGLVTFLTQTIDALADRSKSTTPADEQDPSGRISMDFREREFRGGVQQLLTALALHIDVHLRITRRMPPLIMLQSGHHRILSSRQLRARRRMPGRAVQRVRRKRSTRIDQIKLGFHPVNIKIRLGKGFNTTADRLVAQNDDRTGIFPRQPTRIHRNVKTIFHIPRR